MPGAPSSVRAPGSSLVGFDGTTLQEQPGQDLEPGDVLPFALFAVCCQWQAITNHSLSLSLSLSFSLSLSLIVEVHRIPSWQVEMFKV